MLLTEKQQKYQPYHQWKYINIIFSQAKTLPYHQSRITEQAKFTYSALGKAFEKHIKTTEDQVIKQVKALKVLKTEENQELESIEELLPKNMRTNQIKIEIDETK